MSVPPIAVIIPVFDEAAYLSEALESVLVQTLPPTEIVVVDDGSSDGSAAVARSFAPRVRCERQPHAGAGAARNRGVASTKAELLAFLDADDLWHPEKLALQVQALTETPRLEAVFVHLVNFLSPDLEQGRAASLVCPPDPIPCTTAVAMLIRRSAFTRIGGFDESGAIGEVVEWYARARSLGIVETMLPQTLVRRRIHANNTGITRVGERRRYVEIVKAALDRRRAADRNAG